MKIKLYSIDNFYVSPVKDNYLAILKRIDNLLEFFNSKVETLQGMRKKILLNKYYTSIDVFEIDSLEELKNWDKKDWTEKDFPF
uniref:Uncharacterized protein n=1 Tax=Dictyoglomus turgidum TaxID=513050 RepID=A0A7C3WLM2_9BACT